MFKDLKVPTPTFLFVTYYYQNRIFNNYTHLSKKYIFLNTYISSNNRILQHL